MICPVEMLVTDYTDEDAAPIAKLLATIPGLRSTSEQSFRSYAAQSFNCGAKDFRTIRVDGDLAAVLLSTLIPGRQPPRRHFRILVHPDHRGRGLGKQLMMTLQQQSALPSEVAQCNSQKSWGACNAFLEHFEFRVEARELLMRLTKASERPAPSTENQDLVIRSATSDDDETWSTLHRDAYGDRDDFSDLTKSDQDQERDSPGFGLWVAEEHGRIAGYCHVAHLEATEALINSLVVRPEMQGKGVARLLLATSNQHLWQSGVDSISLNVVADHAAAIHIYEAAGYQSYDELLRYQRSF